MAIESMFIKNFKSIKKLNIKFSTINCLIGENGSGKSNILKAISYFHNSLTDNSTSIDIIDKNNPYNKHLIISVKYDFSRLFMIARNRENNDIDLNPFFKNIFTLRNKYLDKDDTVTIELKEDKKGNREWNVPYEVRLFIKNIYPIYLIEARHINLTEWDYIWNIISDLGRIKSFNANEFEEKMRLSDENQFDIKIKKIIDDIQKEFLSNNISLNSLTTRERFINYFQLVLNGKEFIHNEKKLDFFSDGTNSYNYICLLINLLNKVSRIKLIEPLIVLDEPEIGLHPKYIDKLVENIVAITSPVKIILSTHSSRIVKEALSYKIDSNFYHITSNMDYTYLNRMDLFFDSKRNNKVSEKEANLFFSKFILVVEGPTEYELLTNRNLLKLFPILKNIDFYAFDSDNVKLKFISPDKTNTNIPYLIMVDMDKILKYHKSSNKFIFNKDSLVNPFVKSEVLEREKLYYGEKRRNTYNLHQRIIGIKNKSKFYFDSDWGYSSDEYYFLLKNLVKEYCKSYNIYPLDTTVEGLLINNYNLNIVYSWLVKTSKNNIINEIYNHNDNKNYKLTALRLIHSGKCDNLDNASVSDEEERKIINKIYSIKRDKTSGWISEFLDYFFNDFIDNKKYNINEVRYMFRYNFPELAEVIDYIEGQINK